VIESEPSADHYFTAEEAKAFGLVDEVLEKPRTNPSREDNPKSEYRNPKKDILTCSPDFGFRISDFRDFQYSFMNPDPLADGGGSGSGREIYPCVDPTVVERTGRENASSTITAAAEGIALSFLKGPRR